EELKMQTLQRTLFVACGAFIAATAWSSAMAAEPRYYDVPKGGRPHDVAADPAAGGPVYYTAQGTGKTEEIALGSGSAPHGVIVGPDGAAWVTDGGQNAMVRVDAKTRAVRVWKLPEDTGYANLNTPTLDANGRV